MRASRARRPGFLESAGGAEGCEMFGKRLFREAVLEEAGEEESDLELSADLIAQRVPELERAELLSIGAQLAFGQLGRV